MAAPSGQMLAAPGARGSAQCRDTKGIRIMPRIMRTLHATFSSRGVAEPQKHAQSVAPRRFIQWLRAAAVMPMMSLLLLAPSAALAAATPASHGPLGVVYATQAT